MEGYKVVLAGLWNSDVCCYRGCNDMIDAIKKMIGNNQEFIERFVVCLALVSIVAGIASTVVALTQPPPCSLVGAYEDNAVRNASMSVGIVIIAFVMALVWRNKEMIK